MFTYLLTFLLPLSATSSQENLEEALAIFSAICYILRDGGAMPKISVEERFWRRVHKTDTCWEREGASTAGYPVITIGGTPVYGHHYAWKEKAGPIPEGFHILHTCDVRRCVRNDEEGTYIVNGIVRIRWGHLWCGTNDDNMQDMMNKGRWGGARRSGWNILFHVAVEIASKYKDGATVTELAETYQITEQQVHEIVEKL